MQVFSKEKKDGKLNMSSQNAEKRNNEVGIETLKSIFNSFITAGEPISFEQIKKGYINNTYKVVTATSSGETYKYVLQRINTNVFPDTDALMNNFLLVTEYMADNFELPGHKKGEKSILTLCLTKTRHAYLPHETGNWRVTRYFENTYSLDVPDKPETFGYAGEAFGLFAKKAAGIDPNKITEVIPNFHNTKKRYAQLLKSIEADPVGRVKDVSKEIETEKHFEKYFNMIADPLEKGEIPTRICHNDCNLNNILFDKETRLPVAIIDLDTVMPSTPLYDYGDSMRVGTNKAGDDETDLSKVVCDLELYRQYARGYLKSCGTMLTKRELELLPYACIVITLEDSIRFLMDYIDGDTYYQTSYETQNLDRCRTQQKLASDMEQKLPEIKKILNDIYAEFKLN